MSESIRPDKEDRYFSEDSSKKTLSPKLKVPILTKKKWVILILAVLIILLLLSFAIFKPKPQNQQSNDATILTNNNINNTTDYQTLTPPDISREATAGEQTEITGQERIEIPGDVTDILADKIIELNGKDSQDNPILFESQNNQIEQKANELPLTKNLEIDHYTIQMNSSSSFENMMSFVKQYNISNYQIYETRREQKPWFILIKGNYAAIDDAKQAIKFLPLDLQKSTPWIKSGTQVNNEKLSQ